MGLLEYLNDLPTKQEAAGEYGEWLAKIVADSLDDSLVIRDLLIDSEGGRTQIDLVIIRPAGIYVAEVKMFGRARVYGNIGDREWAIYRGGIRRPFYSPVLQNKNHIRYLKKLFGDRNDLPFYSLIIMECERARIEDGGSGDMSGTLICTSWRRVTRGIKLFETERPRVLDMPAMENLRDVILAASRDDKQSRLLHDRQTAEHVEALKNKPVGVCPECGSPLVLRTGRYGEFYGCSAYPDCKYTEKRR